MSFSTRHTARAAAFLSSLTADTQLWKPYGAGFSRRSDDASLLVHVNLTEQGMTCFIEYPSSRSVDGRRLVGALDSRGYSRRSRIARRRILRQSDLLREARWLEILCATNGREAAAPRLARPKNPLPARKVRFPERAYRELQGICGAWPWKWVGAGRTAPARFLCRPLWTAVASFHMILDEMDLLLLATVQLSPREDRIVSTSQLPSVRQAASALLTPRGYSLVSDARLLRHSTPLLLLEKRFNTIGALHGERNRLDTTVFESQSATSRRSNS